MISKLTLFYFFFCLISVSLCTEQWPCPEPPLIANGEALVRWDGLVALYRCTVGYVLRGSPTMSCVGNKWIGPPPYCIPEELYAPPTQLFGDRERKFNSPKEVPPRYSTLRTISGRHYQQEYNLPHEAPQVESPSYSRPLFQWDPIGPSAQRTSPNQHPVSEHHKNSRHYQVTKRLLGPMADTIERPLNIRTVVVHAKPQQDAPKSPQRQGQPKKRRKQRKGGGGRKSRINAENDFAERRVLSSPPPPIHPEESLKLTDNKAPPVEIQGNRTYHVTESSVRMIAAANSFVPMPQEAIHFEELDMSCLQDSGDGNVYFLEPPTIDNGQVDMFRRRQHQSPDAPINASYLEAYYACQAPFRLRKDYEHSLYCAKGLWVGQIPVCVSTAEPDPVVVEQDSKVVKPNLEDVDLCLVDRGGCEQLCENVPGIKQTKCLCFRGYSLRDDNKTCADINECLVRNGDCQLSCWNMPGSYICYCPEGYTLSSDRQSCTDKNECLLRNGHGPCQDKCTNTIGGYLCTCTIQGTQLAMDNHTCEDIDECTDNNYGCSHTCLNTIGSAFCTCPEGFMLSADWKTCTDIDECEYPEMVMGCSGHCINTVGSYTCGTTGNDGQAGVEELRASTSHLTVCGEGHQADGDGECVDIDECASNDYGCSHECINTEGSAVCHCPEGLQLLEDWKTCDDVNECQQGNNGCSHTCVNIHASAYCACPSGFELSPDLHTCQDVNECSAGNLTCEYQCVNTLGSAHCSCPDGFHLATDAKSCQDVNECLTENHICSEICLNTYGSYHCACPEGYLVSERDHTQCQDINECLADNGGCSGDCINSEGSYHCSCSPFHRLASDERTCIADACPASSVPDGGEIICKAPRISGHYPIGTGCEVRCGADTKLVGSSQITCMAEGKWDTSGHYCLRVPDAEVPEATKVTETDEDEVPIANVQLRCPPQLTVDLHSGGKTSRITLPKPQFDLRSQPEPEVRVTPSWAQGYVGEFPPGTTIVTYSSLSSECSFKVTVLDKEPPTVQDCPEPFDAELVGDSTTAMITWKEPTFHDNVGVDYMWKSKEPGSEFPLGLHDIRYLARDAAGNSIQCNFDINVKYGETGVTATSPPTPNVQFQWNKLGCTYINSQKTDWLMKWPALQGCLNSPRTRVASNTVRASTAFNYQARGIIQQHYSEKVVTHTRGAPNQDLRASAHSPQHKQ